jgi:hypothetical protein
LGCYGGSTPSQSQRASNKARGPGGCTSPCASRTSWDCSYLLPASKVGEAAFQLEHSMAKLPPRISSHDWSGAAASPAPDHSGRSPLPR